MLCIRGTCIARATLCSGAWTGGERGNWILMGRMSCI